MTYEFNVELQPDGEVDLPTKAELVGAGPEVPYGLGRLYEAILDLCESMTEEQPNEPAL